RGDTRKQRFGFGWCVSEVESPCGVPGRHYRCWQGIVLVPFPAVSDHELILRNLALSGFVIRQDDVGGSGVVRDVARTLDRNHRGIRRSLVAVVERADLDELGLGSARLADLLRSVAKRHKLSIRAGVKDDLAVPFDDQVAGDRAFANRDGVAAGVAVGRDLGATLAALGILELFADL